MRSRFGWLFRKPPKRPRSQGLARPFPGRDEISLCLPLPPAPANLAAERSNDRRLTRPARAGLVESAEEKALLHHFHAFRTKGIKSQRTTDRAKLCPFRQDDFGVWSLVWHGIGSPQKN